MQPIAHPERFRRRWVFLVWGLLTLTFGLLMWQDLQGMGWPDGSMTPFAADTRTVQTILMVAVIAQAVFFLLVAVLTPLARAVRPAVLVLAAFVTVIPLAAISNCEATPGCVAAYQAIWGKPFDNGAGG